MRDLAGLLYDALGEPFTPRLDRSPEQSKRVAVFSAYLHLAVDALSEAVDVSNEARLYQGQPFDHSKAIASAVDAAKRAREGAAEDVSQSPH